MKGLKLKCGIEWFRGDFWIGLGVREDEKGKSNPSRAYVRDAKAMAAATPADVAEYPNCYVFVVDMPQR